MIEVNLPTDDEGKYLEGQSAVIEVDITSPLTSTEFGNSSFEFTLAERAGESPVLNKTDGNGDVRVISQTKQQIEIEMDKSDTDGLGTARGAEYHYEVVLETPSGERAYVTSGNWTIYAASTPIP